MALSAPTRPAWIIAVVLGVLGLLGKFVAIPYVTVNAFWLLAVAFVVLAIATAVKGL
jgi:type IV secretory pathway VirB3-like protein